MALQPIEIELGSGMNDTTHEANLAAGEAPLVRNGIPRGNQWDTRKGCKNIQATPSGSKLLNLFAFRTNDDADYLLGAGIRNGVQKQSGAGWVAISQQGVALFSDLDRPPWQMVVKGLISYGIRPGMVDTIPNVGRMYHVTKDRITKAGIAQPAQVTVANGVGGGLPVGTWLCGLKYVLDAGTADETESDLSEPTEVTTALNDLRQWTVIESAHPRCNKIRFFVSVDGGASLFRIAELPNNTFTFTESVLEADYGDEAFRGMTFPPVNPLGFVVWDGVAWVHDGNDLWHSEPGRSYEEYDPLKAFKINRPPNTPSQFRGIMPWDGTRLAVGMEYSLHYLVRDQGSLVGYRVEDVSTNIGLAGTHAMCVLEGTLFWYSGTQVWATTGGTPVCISDKRIERTLASIPPGNRDRVFMAANEDTGQVFMSVPDLTGENVWTLAFSVRDGKWAINTYYDSADGTDHSAPHWMGYVPTAPSSGYNGGKYFGATFFDGPPNLAYTLENTLYKDEDNSGSTDIRQEYITESVQAEGLGLAVRRVLIAIGQRNATTSPGSLPNDPPGPGLSPIQVTLSLRLDGNRETATKTVTLPSRTEWLAVNLNNVGDPARTVALHVVVPSHVQLSFYGLNFSASVMRRRIGRAA